MKIVEIFTRNMCGGCKMKFHRHYSGITLGKRKKDEKFYMHGNICVHLNTVITWVRVIETEIVSNNIYNVL